MDNEIINKVSEGAKMWAVLIDPDKAILETLPELCTSINMSSCDYVLVGGSLINGDKFESCITIMKSYLKKRLSFFLEIMFKYHQKQMRFCF